MITASQDLKNIFYRSTTVNIAAGCTIEYNMNSLLDNITISTTILDSDYINTITPGSGDTIRINPYKKLFPIDSVLKPFRPIDSGIKYYIGLASDHAGSNIFYDYRTLPYPSSSPRVYYAGLTNAYKYWVAPVNTGINATVKYVQSSATVTEAYATGQKVVYKTSQDHGFTIGQRVTITGSGNSSFNLTNQVISGIPSSKTFYVTNSLSSASVTGLSKTATLVNSSGVATPTKPALANKIIVSFEKYHALPATCSIVITYNDNTTASPSAFSVPSNGNLIVYFNGTAWSTTPPFSSSQPISYPAPKEIKTISVTTPSAGAGKIIGVREISARWIKDISSDLISFDIEKESTSDEYDLLPVGNLTANSLQLSLVKYNQSNLRVLTYNRDENWTVSPAPNDVIYFAKNAEIKPHLKVYHSNGAVTDGSLKYDIVPQGTYFLNSHQISEYGDVSVEALDGAKQLMETLVPDLIYEDAPATSIISSMLDAIGFSNYNINIATSGSASIDTSIPNIRLWWSENNKTVWDCIQEICRDIQMNAIFDENNILQFYSRDYLYSKSTVDWEFTETQTGQTLPNIVSFNKKEIASANQVKVIWKVPMSSLYTQSGVNLWSSETSFLVAGGLREPISASTPAELINFYVDIESADSINRQILSTFGYAGYFLIDSEIFEYDAIQYQYVALGDATNTFVPVWIGSQADWSTYRSLSKTGSEYFKPTGKYRIINRALFGTAAADHSATSEAPSSWTLVEDSWVI